MLISILFFDGTHIDGLSCEKFIMHIFLKGDYYIELRSWGAYSLFLIRKLWCRKQKKLENGLLYMVPTSPGKSWNLKRGLESPGILLKFWKSPWKVLNFLWSNSPKERLLRKQQHFLGFFCMLNPAVHWLTAVIFIWGILDAIMFIYYQHITG